jgi:hypothetical protein
MTDESVNSSSDQPTFQDQPSEVNGTATDVSPKTSGWIKSMKKVQELVSKLADNKIQETISQPTTQVKDTITDFEKLGAGCEFHGDIIAKIIFGSKDFVIYTTEKYPERVRYFVANDTCEENLKEILVDLVKLNFELKLNGELEENCSYIAAIYMLTFVGRISDAKELIAKLSNETSVGQDIRKRGKVNYLAYCLGFAVVAVLSAVVLKYTLSSRFEEAFNYYKIAVCGSIGGFLSISIKLRSATYSFDRCNTLQILSAVSRIFISMFSAVIVYFFIQSNFLLGFLNNVPNHFLFYCFAFIAGFSETFVPDIFGIAEKKTVDTAKK